MGTAERGYTVWDAFFLLPGGTWSEVKTAQVAASNAEAQDVADRLLGSTERVSGRKVQGVAVINADDIVDYAVAGII